MLPVMEAPMQGGLNSVSQGAAFIVAAAALLMLLTEPREKRAEE
jgi:hypothetical protein